MRCNELVGEAWDRHCAITTGSTTRVAASKTRLLESASVEALDSFNNVADCNPTRQHRIHRRLLPMVEHNLAAPDPGVDEVAPALAPLADDTANCSEGPAFSSEVL